MGTSIWWIRRDLRLRDNQALQLALSRVETIIPVFILDEHILSIEAPRRQAFLFNSLRALDADLRKLGSSLVVRSGDPAEELTRLYKESGAGLITAEADHSPYARRRDESIAKALPLRLTSGITIQPPGSAVKNDGGTYTVFTPFRRAWLALPNPGAALPPPLTLRPHKIFSSQPIPAPTPLDEFPAGEENAVRRLHEFLKDAIGEYDTLRDRMDLDNTSRLSPYIRFGVLSPRYIYMQLTDQNNGMSESAGVQSWLNELIWREFYFNIMAAFPYVLKSAFRRNLRNIPWRDAPQDLKAWQNGLSGYPIVDAGMRQLSETGWMHNRARMITASFLTKDLLINWQEGEAWFMRMLVDGDPASNNGGWQWTAGTGTDAAPYFRIFNPALQSRKFDPQGDYIRRWVPELANVPDKYIHEPGKMPTDIQSSCGVHIGREYPQAIVDHRSARERALAAYKAAG